MRETNAKPTPATDWQALLAGLARLLKLDTEGRDETDVGYRWLESLVTNVVSYRVRRSRFAWDVEAAVQDVLVETIGAIDRYRPERSPPGYYFRMVARRRASNWLRRKRQSAAASGVEARLDAFPSPVGPTDADALLDLAEAVAALPPRDQALVRLRQDGWTPMVIADRLSVSPAAVRQALLRIRGTLRRRLTP